ncbi:MAG: hypothetical protein IPH40_06820 [Polaromonas sp.]|nr:hypothetical protein [Polaromonas sp.]
MAEAAATSLGPQGSLFNNVSGTDVNTAADDDWSSFASVPLDVVVTNSAASTRVRLKVPATQDELLDEG